MSPSSAYGRLPLSFEENVGQTDARVKFLSRGAGATVFFTATEAVLAFRAPQSTLRLGLKKANRAPHVVGLGALPGTSHYLIGNDPRAWHTDVAHFGRLQYSSVYPGIDLIYYGNEQELEYDFLIAPGADPSRIQLEISGVERLRIDANGDLLMQTVRGELRQRKPLVYQKVGTETTLVPGQYVLKGRHTVGFRLGPYDATRPLVIDPVLLFSTYLGGSVTDGANGIAIDWSGNAYVTGETGSLNFPTTGGAYRVSSAGNTDVFVSKISPNGTTLLYSTYVGGAGADRGGAVAIDEQGHAYISGRTSSENFPVTGGAFQLAFRGGIYDSFVTKLLPSGAGLVYSTYLGGAGNDAAFGIAVDSAASAYVTGGTSSDDFPITPGVLQPIPGGGQNDAFVTKLAASGGALAYSTYVGGVDVDRANAIALVSTNAVITGWTESSDFPVADPVQPTFGGIRDAFVTTLNATGNTALYSTFLGGNGTDAGVGIAVDGTGQAHVTGYTESTNFPTANAWQPSSAGGRDAFISKLNTSGNALQYSTYLGGSSNENLVDDGTTVGGIGIDGAGAAHVTGATRSTNFPIINAVQPMHRGGPDETFVTRFNPVGTAVFSTYLGGGASDAGTAIAVHYFGTAYLAGRTSSANFPIVSAVQPIAGGAADAFVAAVEPVADLALWKFDWPDPVVPGATLTYWVSVYNNGVDQASWPVLEDDVPFNTTFQSVTVPTGWSCSTPAVGGTGTLTCWAPTFEPAALATFVMEVRVNQPVPIGTAIWNVATIWSLGTRDLNSNNNWGVVTTTVGAGAGNRRP